MMKCLLCQTLNNPNSRFCSGCGAQFTSEVSAARKNSLSTPVIIIVVVIALCALCGLCSRSARDRNQSVSAPVQSPANANTNTYAPSAFVSTDSTNKAVNANAAVSPSPVARKKKVPKKPPVIANTPEPIADGEDAAIDSDADSVSGTDAPVYSAPAERSVAAPRGGNSGYYTGPRGGCYTYSASGKKRYVDHSYCN